MPHSMLSKKNVWSAKHHRRIPVIYTLDCCIQRNIIKCKQSGTSKIVCASTKSSDSKIVSSMQSPKYFILFSFYIPLLSFHWNAVTLHSYGYVTNSKIKFIIVVDSSNTALRENDVRTVSVPNGKIVGRTFTQRKMPD